MPRRGRIAKRDVLPDPMYNSKLVTRLINNIMLDGKRGVAQKIVYGAFDIIKEKTGNDALDSFEKAMEYFQVGKDKDGYAEAKAALRDETVREYFGLVAAVVILAMIGILGYDQIKDIINKISWAIIRRKGE